MSDIYLTIAEQPDSVLDAVASSLEIRAADPEMQHICADYMSRIPLPEGGRVLEIGCGSGAATKLFLAHHDPAEMLCTDPSPGLLQRADPALAGDPRVRFATADAAATGAPDASFDVVQAHTVYSHLPDPPAALAEAHRVLKPGGHAVIFDGDYATISMALFDDDPLQSAVPQVQRNMIHGPYVMRQMPGLLAEAGFEPPEVRAYGYVKTTDADYLRSAVARGLNAAGAAGELGEGIAAGYLSEIDRRLKEGIFYGSIMFLSMIARKPG